jgi:hypothetical protein
MRVLLSMYKSRDAETMVGLVVQLWALGAEPLSAVGAPLIPTGVWL